MPIYEYRCEACGHEHEAMQKMADSPLTDCPECSEPALVKRVSAAGFRLKGSGWFQTDFKGGGSTDTSEQKQDTGGHTCSSGACTTCS